MIPLTDETQGSKIWEVCGGERGETAACAEEVPDGETAEWSEGKGERRTLQTTPGLTRQVTISDSCCYENRTKSTKNTHKPKVFPFHSVIVQMCITLFTRRLCLQERVNKYKKFEEFLMKTLELLPESKSIWTQCLFRVFSGVSVSCVL